MGWGGNEAACGMHTVSLPACIPASCPCVVPCVLFAWVPSSSRRSPAWVPSSPRRVPSSPLRCPVPSSSRPRVGVHFLAPPSPRGRGGDVALSTQGVGRYGRGRCRDGVGRPRGGGRGRRRRRDEVVVVVVDTTWGGRGRHDVGWSSSTRRGGGGRRRRRCDVVVVVVVVVVVEAMWWWRSSWVVVIDVVGIDVAWRSRRRGSSTWPVVIDVAWSWSSAVWWSCGGGWWSTGVGDVAVVDVARSTWGMVVVVAWSLSSRRRGVVVVVVSSTWRGEAGGRRCHGLSTWRRRCGVCRRGRCGVDMGVSTGTCWPGGCRRGRIDVAVVDVGCRRGGRRRRPSPGCARREH